MFSNSFPENNAPSSFPSLETRQKGRIHQPNITYNLSWLSQQVFPMHFYMSMAKHRKTCATPFLSPMDRDSHLKITLLSTSVNCSCLNIPPNTPEPSFPLQGEASKPTFNTLTSPTHSRPYQSRYFIWKTRGDHVLFQTICRHLSTAFLVIFALCILFECTKPPNKSWSLNRS